MISIVVAAERKDIGKIHSLFSSNFAKLKGGFPAIKNLYDEINERKYTYDKKSKTGGEKESYPLNCLKLVKDSLKENDIVIIPVDSKLIKSLKKYKKIERLYIYEEDPTESLNHDPDSDIFHLF